MSIDHELIHRLVLEELAGVISEEDLAFLKKTIRENPEAYNIWMETRTILDAPDVKAFLERPRPVEQIFNKTIRNSNRPGTWMFSLSIIIAMIIGICIFKYFHPFLSSCLFWPLAHDK